jgi:uncharacterized protein YdcH (DUF465 family)
MADRAFGNKKDIGEIRQGPSVKLKKREPVEEPQIVQDVKDLNNSEPPTEDALKLMAQLSGAKQKLFESMKEFNKLLNNRTLPENKSTVDKDLEQNVVNSLAQSAMVVEQLSPKEGLLAICILAIRQSLSLRDAGNEIAHRIISLENRISKLESSSKESSPSETKEVKKQMIELSDMLKKLAEGTNE